MGSRRSFVSWYRAGASRRCFIVALSCWSLFACAQAHDLDAVSANVRDGGAIDEGGGFGGDDGAGSGASGSGSSTSGRGGSGASDSGSGGTGSGSAGSSGGTGQPVFGNVSSCAPCMGAEGSMGPLEPCCTADGACGLDLGDLNGLGPTCAQQNAPGMESMSCPEYVFEGNFMLTSCCGADGFCGVMIMQTAPLGCVDPALLGDLVMPAEDMGGGMMFGGGMFGMRGGQDRDDGPPRCGAAVD
jgi:hypothetical protein